MREMSTFSPSMAHNVFTTDHSRCIQINLQDNHIVSHRDPATPIFIDAPVKTDISDAMLRDQQQDNSRPRRDYFRLRKSRITRSTSGKKMVGNADRMAESHTRHVKPRVKALHKRTKTGCLTCRKRRIKCDEEKPICERCIKSRRLCIFPSQPSITSDTKEGDSDQKITFSYESSGDAEQYQSPAYEAILSPVEKKVASPPENPSQQTDLEEDQEAPLLDDDSQVKFDYAKFPAEKRSNSCISFGHDRIPRRFGSPTTDSRYIDPLRLQRRSVPVDIYSASEPSLESIMLSSYYDGFSIRRGLDNLTFRTGEMFSADYQLPNCHTDKLPLMNTSEKSNMADSYDEIPLANQWIHGNKITDSTLAINDQFPQPPDYPPSEFYDTSSSYSRDSRSVIQNGSIVDTTTSSFNGNQKLYFMDKEEHSPFDGGQLSGMEDLSIFQNSGLDNLCIVNQILHFNEADNMWPPSQLSVPYGTTSKVFTSV